jgi:GNAT superfamily N-acetyltransferase
VKPRHILRRLLDSVDERPDAEYHLKDGFVLRRYGPLHYKFFAPPLGDIDSRCAGYINLAVTSGYGMAVSPAGARKIPYVADVVVYRDYRGRGLYRQALPILKHDHGAVRSSHSGSTSDDADAAWKAVKARQLDPDRPMAHGGHEEQDTYGWSSHVLETRRKRSSDDTAFHQAEYALKDGFTLRRYTETAINYPGSDYFMFVAPDGRDAGYLIINTRKIIPHIETVRIYDEFRGHGLYRQALPILKQDYGAIRSDHNQATSPEARRAWLAVKAKEPPTGYDGNGLPDPEGANRHPDAYTRYGDSYFVLEAGNGPHEYGLKVQAEYNLKGGFILRRYTINHAAFYNESDYYRFVAPDGEDAGHLVVFVGGIIPCIETVKIYDKFRGLGLYRQALPILKHDYGAIRSDHYRCTSQAADQAWQAIKARKLPFRKDSGIGDPPVGSKYGDSSFVLEADEFDVKPGDLGYFVFRGKRVCVDLGDGYFACKTWDENDNPPRNDNHTWTIFVGDGNDSTGSDRHQKVGELSLTHYEDLDRWTIWGAHISDFYRGKGLMRRLLKVLSKEGHYKRLGSDPQGNTSKEAVKMWRAIKAKRSPTDKNSKGRYYTLGEVKDVTRVCMHCDQDHEKKHGHRVPGVNKSHGYCRRHHAQLYKKQGWSAMLHKAHVLPDTEFCQDLGIC